MSLQPKRSDRDPELALLILPEVEEALRQTLGDQAYEQMLADRHMLKTADRLVNRSVKPWQDKLLAG